MASLKHQGARTRPQAFLMISYANTEQLNAISKVIESTLDEYSLALVRADMQLREKILWENVQQYMHSSQYGVAVFEKLAGEAAYLNVSLELGYMMAQDKPCLLLKEKGVKSLPTDLRGHLYRTFDGTSEETIERSLPPEVIGWLRDLGIAKRKGARLLVFLSAGGTCRDPMAKVIMEKLLHDRPPGFPIQVAALALTDPTRQEASAAAREVIKEAYNADLLAEHRPRRITPKIIEEANLILVMDDSLLSPKTLPAEKTSVLKPFLGEQGNVKDPWRRVKDKKTLYRYRRCRDELRRVLERHFDRLVNALRQSSGR